MPVEGTRAYLGPSATQGKVDRGMCGRFTYRYTWSEIHALYRLTTPPANLQPRYNICPTTTINTVVARDGTNEFVPMRWFPEHPGRRQTPYL